MYCQNNLGDKYVVRFCVEISERLSGYRNRGVPVYRDFYTMKVEGENLGPSQLVRFEGIPVYRGSDFEGFHCKS